MYLDINGYLLLLNRKSREIERGQPNTRSGGTMTI
jgi:hypothetical protein